MLRLLSLLCLLVCASIVLLACSGQGSGVPVSLGAGLQSTPEVVTSVLPTPEDTPTPTSTPYPLAMENALTQQAIHFATVTAWASITPTLAPPTATPTPGGIDLTDPDSWTRHTDATGISFEHLHDHVVSYFDPRIYRFIEHPEIPPDKIGAAHIHSTSFYSDTESVPDTVDRFFTVETWRGGEIGDKLTYPFNIGFEGSQFAALLELEGATRAWLITESGGSYQVEGGTCCEEIKVWLYNEQCQLEVVFSTDLGNPGPIEDVLLKPLDEVVAEHFPVFDHMFRSVQFPPGCSSERSPAPANWATYTDVTGVTFDYPAGEDIPLMGQGIDDSVIQGNTELRPNPASANDLHETVIVFTWRAKDLDAENPAITDYWPPSRGNAVHFPVAFNLPGAAKTLLFLIGDFPASDAAFNDAWITGVHVNAASYNDQCQILVLFWGGFGMFEVDQLPDMPLDQIVAEDFPVFDHMYRSVRFPPECVE